MSKPLNDLLPKSQPRKLLGLWLHKNDDLFIPNELCFDINKFWLLVWRSWLFDIWWWFGKLKELWFCWSFLWSAAFANSSNDLVDSSQFLQPTHLHKVEHWILAFIFIFFWQWIYILKLEKTMLKKTHQITFAITFQTIWFFTIASFYVPTLNFINFVAC